jgi:hypothetical protein
MNSSKTRFIPGVAIAAMFPLIALGASPSHRCATQYDDAQRLACYDAEFGKPVRPPGTPPSVPVAPRTAAVPVPETAPTPNPVKETEFTAKVTALVRPIQGRMVFSLDNGQKWMQLEPDPLFQVAVGDVVTLKPGIVGSRFLISPKGGRTRVTLGR